MTRSGSVSIVGGADSIAADFVQMSAFATVLERLATQLCDTAARTLAVLADPDLISAAVLDPAGAAEVAYHGVNVSSLCLRTAVDATAVALCLRVGVRAYRSADALRAQYLPVVRALVNSPLALTELIAAPADVLTGNAARLQRVLVDDPELADVVLGVASMQTVCKARLATMAGLLATQYRDGSPVLSRPPSPVTDDAAGAPRSSTDLLRGLAVRNLSEADPHSGGGMIDVRLVGRPGQSRRSVIVDLPGTTRWNLDPHTSTPQVSDFATNLRALAQQSSVYERGVLAALRAADVRPDEPIMLVGHSEGGLVAARIASSLKRGGQFHVTQLVTAGAPIGLDQIPDDVSVLALENKGDVVPHLDARDNPDRPNWITAFIDRGDRTIAERHSLESYLAGAADLDASSDRSIRAWRESAAEFLDGAWVQTEVYQVRRAP